jgi:hypothetical protein
MGMRMYSGLLRQAYDRDDNALLAVPVGRSTTGEPAPTVVAENPPTG